MWCLNPTKETVKILGVHFYYNKKLEHEMNFQSNNVKIENVLRLWHTRNWATEEKASAFTSLAISKIVYLSPITTLPLAIISQLSNIKKTLYGTGKKSKNRITLSNSYKDGGLKDVDVFTKVINLQCCWIKRLFDENLHKWKIILAYLIKTNFCENLKFYPCLKPNPNIRSLKNVPNFYREMKKNWERYLSCFP